MNDSIQGRTSVETEVPVGRERDEITGSPDITSLRTHSWRGSLHGERVLREMKQQGVLFFSFG